MQYTKSKAIKQNFEHYIKNLDTLPQTIYEAYSRPSENKVDIFDYWRNYVNTHKAQGLRILSHSCHFFSIGFIGVKDNEEYFVWITPYNQRYCRIRELENDN